MEDLCKTSRRVPLKLQTVMPARPFPICRAGVIGTLEIISIIRGTGTEAIRQLRVDIEVRRTTRGTSRTAEELIAILTDKFHATTSKTTLEIMEGPIMEITRPGRITLIGMVISNMVACSNWILQFSNSMPNQRQHSSNNTNIRHSITTRNNFSCTINSSSNNNQNLLALLLVPSTCNISTWPAQWLSPHRVSIRNTLPIIRPSMLKPSWILPLTMASGVAFRRNRPSQTGPATASFIMAMLLIVTALWGIIRLFLGAWPPHILLKARL